MTIEILQAGSDEQFRAVADMSEIGRRYRHARLRAALEEFRVRMTLPADDEPGVDHPALDARPDGDPPEFDPLPRRSR
jgi:hypothetical protein